MRWGKEWKNVSFWGLPVDGDPAEVLEYCALATDRVLSQMDDTEGNRKFRDLICALSRESAELKIACNAVINGFDVDSAIGYQLDLIGKVVVLARRGYDDDRYRTFIKIQINSILSAQRDDANWTGTHNNILNICREFIGTSIVDPIVMTNVPPYGFLLSIPGVMITEINILVEFICRALYAGVLGSVLFQLSDDSLWNSDAVSVTNGAFWDSVSNPGSGVGVWGTLVNVGSC